MPARQTAPQPEPAPAANGRPTASEPTTVRPCLSWSAVSTYQSCSLRYMFRYVEGLPEETVVERVWNGIDSNLFYPSPSALNCPTCPFRRQCDAWDA